MLDSHAMDDAVSIIPQSQGKFDYVCDEFLSPSFPFNERSGFR
jgi:hypothetical protein